MVLAAAADLCNVSSVSAILAAIFVIVRRGTATTRMRTLAFVSICHDISFLPYQRQPGEAVETKIYLRGCVIRFMLGFGLLLVKANRKIIARRAL